MCQRISKCVLRLANSYRILRGEVRQRHGAAEALFVCLFVSWRPDKPGLGSLPVKVRVETQNHKTASRDLAEGKKNNLYMNPVINTRVWKVMMTLLMSFYRPGSTYVLVWLDEMCETFKFTCWTLKSSLVIVFNTEVVAPGCAIPNWQFVHT